MFGDPKANEWDLLKRQFDALRDESLGAEGIEEIFDVPFSGRFAELINQAAQRNSTTGYIDRRAVGTFDPESKRGPESFAPPERAPEKPGDADHIAFLRREHAETSPEEALRALIQRVAGASMDEIDRVVGELEGVRNMLRNEGDRVSREIAGYANLSHASMTAMKVIADRIKQWKDEAALSRGPSR